MANVTGFDFNATEIDFDFDTTDLLLVSSSITTTNTSSLIHSPHPPTRNDYEAMLSLLFQSLSLILQTLVIVHFYIKTRKPSRQISKVIKTSVVFVLFFTWIAIAVDTTLCIFDLILHDLDLHSLTYCYTMYYLQYIRILLFEVILSAFWIVRLNHTFKFSVLETKPCIFSLVLLLILSFSIALSALFFVSFDQLKQDHISHQALSANLSNLPFIMQGNTCYLHWNSQILYFSLAEQLLIILENVFFATFFYRKLKALHDITQQSEDLSNQSKLRIRKIYQLQQKHTLLACVPVLVSIAVYTAYDICNFLHFPVSTLYFLTNIDMIIKCICIILFFRFYQRRFGQLCCCCTKCIGYTNDELFPFFNPHLEFRKHNPTIYGYVDKENAKKRSGSTAQAIPEEEEESEDEFNEDASRSYHAPDEMHKQLSVETPHRGHHVVASNELDEDEIITSAQHKKYFSAFDMTPEDRVNPRHLTEACEWIESLMGIMIGGLRPPKMSSIAIDEDEEKDDFAQNGTDSTHLNVGDTGPPPENHALFEALKDGMILCDVLNRIKPGIVKGYKESTVPTVQRNNLEIFIEGCRKLGIPDIDIFDTNDLFEKQRLSAVLKCIFALSAKAKVMPGFSGPTIGYKYSEKNERKFSTKTMNKTKSAVPLMHKPAIQMEQTVVNRYGMIKV